MQYVNDDMDELFRRAAKDYPLNTGGADWEKLQKALDEPPVGEKSASGRKDRRHLLWLLLLLPLPWICTRFSGVGDKGPTDASISKEHTPAATEREMGGGLGSKVVKVEPKTVTKASTGSIGAPSSFSTIDGSSTSPLPRKGVYKAYSKPPLYEASARERRTETTGVSSALPERAPGETLPSTALVEKREVVPVPVKDSLQQDTTTVTATESKAQKPQSPRLRRFYVGMIGGADLTSVEMQEIKKAGYDIGGVVGYSINKHWSVEAGLLSSEKAYYSSGEHLYKAYVIPGTLLREAQGDCRMWEVPLVVRYQFAPEKKGGWFAAAGSSSYFMKKESYDYTYYYTATGQEVKRSRSYNSDSRHLFAAAQFSGGYRHQVGRTMEVRVEPYVKLPLRKVGYYELPLTSFGVHAGIIKRIR